MLKNAYFLEKKNSKNCLSVRGSPPLNPRWPPAAGVSFPRSLRCDSHLPLQILLSSFLALYAFCSPKKRTK